MKKESKKAKPFVKWVGGKGQLLNQLKELIPEKYNTYYEPFLGGGAMFYELSPKKSHLNDVNKTLIATYQLIKDDTESLVRKLSSLEKKYLSIGNQDDRKNYYYKIRDEYNSLNNGEFKKSLYFIFLNRTTFNGMYRENSKGHFNVPIGSYKNPRILDKENLLLVSEALRGVKLSSTSYIDSVKNAKKGDFVYFDPPYYPLSTTSSFTTYSKDNFLEKEQLELRDLFIKLNKDGVLVMLSNSNTEFIKKAYKDFKQTEVMANRMINAKSDKRGKISEIVITNY